MCGETLHQSHLVNASNHLAWVVARWCSLTAGLPVIDDRFCKLCLMFIPGFCYCKQLCDLTCYVFKLKQWHEYNKHVWLFFARCRPPLLTNVMKKHGLNWGVVTCFGLALRLGPGPGPAWPWPWPCLGLDLVLPVTVRTRLLQHFSRSLRLFSSLSQAQG